VVVALAAVCALFAGSVLVGCGGETAPMSEAAAHRLRTRFTAVRAAVEAHDADAAERALDALRQTVDRLRRRDDVSDSRVADILAAAAVVEDQLVTITTTTTTTTTTAAPPRVTASPAPAAVPDTGEQGPGKEPKEPKERGNGPEGNGKGNSGKQGKRPH
jgi:hypothetical protein